MRSRARNRIPNWVIGAVVVGLLAVASYLVFTRKYP